MRSVTIPRSHDAGSFVYSCPICAADVPEWSYETFDADYFCPVCGTQQRPSRVPVTR